MNESLAKKTVSSAIWTYIAYGLSKTANFLATLVLARLILPEEFGIVGFAVTGMAFLDAMRDLGIGLAIIQRRTEVEEASNTAFWLSIGSNTLMWLLSIVVAPLVALFFDEPLVTYILPIMAFSFVINSFGSIHDALLQREMEFGKRVLPAFFNSVAKGITSIVLALMGFDVWALVFGLIVGQTVYTIVLWIMVDFRPRFTFDPQLAREIFSYGYKIALDSFLSALQANIDYIFIGYFLDKAVLGIYTMAYRMPELIIINFCTVIAQVLFPAYSSIQEDEEQLKNAVLSALRYVSIIVVPAGIGLALISDAFFRTAYEPVWYDAIPIMSALSLYGLFLSISWNIGDLYKAIDRVDLLWKTAFLELAIVVPTLFFLAQESATAVAIGHMITAFFVSLIRLVIAMNILNLGTKETFEQFIPALASAIIMGLAVFGMGQALASLPAFVILIGQLLAGAIAYPSALWFFERDLVLRIVDMLQSRLNKSKSE